MALSLLYHHHHHHHHHPFLILPFLLLSFTTSSHLHEGLKSLHFTLYQHDTLNKTGYIIVNGVARAGFTQTTTPFDTLFALQDPLTLTPNITSKVVAATQATTVTASLDGLESISIAKITLNLKHYKGSISVVSVTINIKPSDHPVVGGTGNFLFVQDYLTMSPVSLVGLTVTYKIEFHLYWPPYATRKSS